MGLLVAGTHYRYRRLNNVTPKLSKLALYDFRGIKPYLHSWLIASLLLVIILIGYIYILAAFERQGIERGKEVKVAIAEGNVFKLQCIQKSGSKEKESLVINLYCGANSCVGVPLNSKSYIYYEAKNIIISDFDENSRCGLHAK